MSHCKHVIDETKYGGTFPLRKGIPCGMAAGAAGQFLASPTDLIKVRMQMDGRRKLEGLKPRYGQCWCY